MDQRRLPAIWTHLISAPDPWLTEAAGGVSPWSQVPVAAMADETPITPHAGPTLNAEGQLTYIGDDGRRYVVGIPPDCDDAKLERLMASLRGGNGLFQQIEALCHRWIGAVQGADLDQRAALVLLLTTLETALEDVYPEGE